MEASVWRRSTVYTKTIIQANVDEFNNQIRDLKEANRVVAKLINLFHGVFHLKQGSFSGNYYTQILDEAALPCGDLARSSPSINLSE